MEQELKEKIISWLYGYSSYEEFVNKKVYEIDRILIENTIEELANKIKYGYKIIWDIERPDIIILKMFLNPGDPERTLTTTGIAFKLKISQHDVYKSLCKTKNQILEEINKRRIMDMSKEEKLGLSVENFNLSNRAISTLIRNNIFTVDELTKITTDKLKTLEYMGSKTSQEIIDRTHSFDMAFEDEETKTSEQSIRRQLEIQTQKRYNLEQEIAVLIKRKQEVENEIEKLLNIVEKENERRYKRKYKSKKLYN